MTLQRWEPVRNFERLHDEMDKLFRGYNTGSSGRIDSEASCSLSVDIIEDKDKVMLKAELPGVDPDAVDISVEDNVLSITGEKKLDNEDRKEDYLRIERYYGKFSRSFSLPPYVDSSKIVANYKDGVLTLDLPKKPETRPRQIKVKASA